MIETVKIGDKEVALSNNVYWAMIYKNQFGKDIVPTLAPAVAVLVDTISALSVKMDKDGRITLGDQISVMDSEALTEAIVHGSGIEFVDFMGIVWAMAKTADSSIDAPDIWFRKFDSFPLDEVFPKVAHLAAVGMVSTKNLKRLQDTIKKMKEDLKPSGSTQSSSQQEKEGSQGKISKR